MSNRPSNKSAASPAKGSGDDSGSKSPGQAPGETVDKIRDLIFGEQMAGYEERFNALESRLVAEVELLRESVEGSFAELKKITEERSAEVEGLSVSRKNLSESLEKLAASIRG